MKVRRIAHEGWLRWQAREWLHYGMGRTRKQAIIECRRNRDRWERAVQTAATITAALRKSEEAQLVGSTASPPLTVSIDGEKYAAKSFTVSMKREEEA